MAIKVRGRMRAGANPYEAAMTSQSFGSEAETYRVRKGLVALSAAVLIALAGCSTAESVGSAVNPGNWFSSDDDKAPTEDAAEEGDANVADVESIPEPEPLRMSPFQPDQIEEGLLADKQHARHTEGPPPKQFGRQDDQNSSITAAPSTPVQEASLAPPDGAGNAPVASIGFATDSAALPADSETLLAQVVSAFKERGGVVRVVGHAADEKVGTAGDATVSLAAARANAVAQTLVTLGLPQDRLKVEADESAEVDAQPRQRVDLYIE